MASHPYNMQITIPIILNVLQKIITKQENLKMTVV